VQEGVRVRLPDGMTWDKLGKMSPADIRKQNNLPHGFLPLPHPNHPEGGMLFPKFHIEEIKKQEGRDLTRFDLDYDLPDHFLPEFPPPIYLTTRPDLGDISKGQVVTLANFFELFKDIFTPKQLDGWRLLLTPFPQQQFNLTDDRRTVAPSQGIACLECHLNGHTNAATHFLLPTSPAVADQIAATFALSDGEKTFLTSGEVGNALLLAGRRHRVAFQAMASASEHAASTTHPAALAAQALARPSPSLGSPPTHPHPRTTAAPAAGTPTDEDPL